MNPQYICLDCECLFDDPKRYVERHGLDTPPYEEHYGCPVCGGIFVPVILCDGCGEPITGDYAKIKPEDKCYCDACYMIKAIGED